MKCWLNGVLCPIEEARIDPQDRGFLLGDGVFETLLATDGGVLHGGRHLTRLFAAARMLDIPTPFAKLEIIAAMQRLLHENQLREGRAVLRLTLTRGMGARGLAPPPQARPTLLLTSIGAPPPPQQMRAVISSHVRNEKSISSRIKSLNYLDNIMARREAVQAGADEALMCNSQGNIAAASSANIFIVTGGVLCTPAVADGALPGIMRALILDAAQQRNLTLREGPITRAELASAQEAFLTNAVIGVCPLLEIDGIPVGAGAIGPITKILQA